MHEKMWGRKAREDGLPRTSCPYTGPGVRANWFAGWDEADAEIKARESALSGG